MNPRQRILAIRLSEKIDKNRQYCNSIGVEVVNNKTTRFNTEKNDNQ